MPDFPNPVPITSTAVDQKCTTGTTNIIDGRGTFLYNGVVNKQAVNNNNGKSKPQTLSEVAGWDTKTAARFADLVLNLKSTPSTRTFVASLIEFSQMYRDVKKNIFSTNFWTDFDGINEYRRARRTKIQLYKKDLLKTADGAHGKTLVLTSRAHKIFYQEYPLSQLRHKKWDGVWTLVMYDLPEKLRTARNLLHRKLTHLGFGALQQSIMISPLSLAEAVQELIEGEELKEYTVVLTAKRILGLTDEEMASTAWNLKELNDLYAKLLEVLPKVKNRRGQKLAEEWRTYFLAVNFEDPYLPFELLPSNWLGEKCKKEFQRMGLGGLLKTLFSL